MARRPTSVLALVAFALAFVAGLLPSGTTAAAEQVNSLGLTATYDVDAYVRWNAGKLDVSSVATVTNDTDAPISSLTFNLVPARIGRIVLGGVLVGTDPAPARIDDQNVFVDLPAGLEPGVQTSVTIDYQATFATRSRGKRWMFAKLNGIISAYRWIPWLSRPYRFATPSYGEPFVTQTAREVRVRLSSDLPGLRFAAAGNRVEGDPGVETYVARDVRDFNFSASPYYQSYREPRDDLELEVYSVGLPRSQLAAIASAAHDQFSSRVGAYPYDRLVIAESGAGAAMESPGLVWIPHATASARLRYLVTHEVAHQWFYGVVGNDQARDPFADEGLTEFLTRSLLGHRLSRCTESELDLGVYDYSSACYYEVIYVQGDNYLDAYRRRVGDDALWAGIRLYYERYAFGLGGTKELLQTLDEVAPAGLGGGHEVRFPRLFPADQ